MLKNRSAITLLDVARVAGVSLKTASRVLNNSPELRQETDQHVRAIMAKLHYQPNELARGLKSKRSGSVAVIVPNLSDPLTAAAIHSVQAAARKRGYAVLLSCLGDSAETERAELEALARRQIDGILLVSATVDKDSLATVLANRVPVVALEGAVRGAELDTISAGHRKAARAATDHLLKHGRRRILAVGTPPYNGALQERLAGYRAVMKQSELKTRELVSEQNAGLTAEALAPLLAGSRGANAILGLNKHATVQVLQAMKALKLNAPKDLALISCEDFELAELVSPGITAIRPPFEELAQNAVEYFFERIGDKVEKKRPKAPRKIVLPTELVLRGSCGCTVQP